jgi:hypothetical protein
LKASNSLFSCRHGTHMIYFKSIIVGLITAVATSLLWILAVFVFPIVIPFLISRITNSGGVGFAVVGSGSILIAGLVGFAVGFYWQFRRLSKRRLQTRQ